MSDQAAANGLGSRRLFLKGSAALGGATLLQARPAHSRFTETPASWQQPGESFSNYGKAPERPGDPIRWISAHPTVPGDGVSWTPLHQLEGTITPNGLHFERHHNGIPMIAADTWELAIHGLTNNPRAFSLNDLLRLPMVSQQLFIECGGNSNALWRKRPVQTWAGTLHGLLSCSEWSGVRLSTILDAIGIKPTAKWLIADGLDAAGVTVSIPMEKALDDAMIALYQNGEPVRAEQGYPARLVLPGWEGITHVKWLRSLMLSDKPLMSKFDTVSYTDLQADGSFERFTHQMGVKSFITSPSPGLALDAKGHYEIKGLAWSGAGSIKLVEVSADGGETWAPAATEPSQPHSLTRFRIPWHWHGQPARLVSRATDETGSVQPVRDALLAEKGSSVYYHFNGTTKWSVAADGSIEHVY